MAERCDIVELINKNPLVRLSQNVYQSKILNKIKERCTERQQRIFSSNHYLFLNYTKKDFVIDLDDAWKWLRFVLFVYRRSPYVLRQPPHYIQNLCLFKIFLTPDADA